MSNVESNKSDVLTTVITILGIAFVVALVSDLIKDVRKNTSSDIVSDEGKEILGDKEKREKLQAAVDHYHKEGNWDLLHKVAE